MSESETAAMEARPAGASEHEGWEAASWMVSKY